jgi:hypothetical protein
MTERARIASEHSLQKRMFPKSEICVCGKKKKNKDKIYSFESRLDLNHPDAKRWCYWYERRKENDSWSRHWAGKYVKLEDAKKEMEKAKKISPECEYRLVIFKNKKWEIYKE